MPTTPVSAPTLTRPGRCPSRHLLPLTGLTRHEFARVLTDVARAIPTSRGRPWALPLHERVLLALAALRTNLTERALAAVFTVSQSTVHRVITHLTPVLAGLLPAPDTTTTNTWVLDGTLIPVHDHARTALSKNYRRSVNTQILITETEKTVVAVSPAWPGNRNDIIVARAEFTHLLNTHAGTILGDGGYRGLEQVTSPARDTHGRTIRDDTWLAHRKRRARVEHVLARLKDWQVLRQCRRRGHSIDHVLHAVAYLHNIKRHAALRLNT